MVAAGLWSLPVRRAPARRSARSDAALRSCRERCRPLVARRRCCHFPSAFSPTKSTSHPPRMTDQPARAAPARSDRSSRSAYTMRHSPIHTPRLTALPRPPRAHLPLLHNCAESEISLFPPPIRVPLHRDKRGVLMSGGVLLPIPTNYNHHNSTRTQIASKLAIFAILITRMYSSCVGDGEQLTPNHIMTPRVVVARKGGKP